MKIFSNEFCLHLMLSSDDTFAGVKKTSLEVLSGIIASGKLRNRTVFIKGAVSDSFVKKIMSWHKGKASDFSFRLNIVFEKDADRRKFFEKYAGNFQVIEAAGGLVENEHRDILLIHRRNKWDLPKGKIDKGESVEAAAVREVEEETGLRGVKIREPLQVSHHIYTYRNSWAIKPTHWYVMTAEDISRVRPQQEEDIDAVGWFTREAILLEERETYPMIRELLFEYIRISLL